MADHNYDERWDRGWRKLERMARQWGSNIDGFSGNFRIGRMLASGDLRLVALYLIEQQPRHGYDLIKAVEDKSQGFYSPSPGIVYPALTFLEEAGFVTSEADGNRKLYTITDAGRQHLADNREAIQSTLDFLGKAGAKMQEFREMGRDGWPFTGEPQQQDGPGRPDERPFGGEHRGGLRHHGGPRHGYGRGPRPDRDMADVIPEVNEARRELKAALAEAVRLRPEDQKSVADILRRAAGEIRQSGRNPGDEIDL
ncbi:MAG TPA: PadR family transcriptional regulator [Devosia sp.]|nr:PadR family transcriptional regulator [Devosia sp.]